LSVGLLGGGGRPLRPPPGHASGRHHEKKGEKKNTNILASNTKFLGQKLLWGGIDFQHPIRLFNQDIPVSGSGSRTKYN